MTALVHGQEAWVDAETASIILFSAKLEHRSDEELLAAFKQAPRFDLSKSELISGIGLVDVLHRCGMFPSRAEAKRKINEGGVYLNNQRIDDQNYKLTLKDLASEHFIVLRSGKKKYHLIRVD
jgi:tyrosyl-tRNA synthetase